MSLKYDVLLISIIHNFNMLFSFDLFIIIIIIFPSLVLVASTNGLVEAVELCSVVVGQDGIAIGGLWRSLGKNEAICQIYNKFLSLYLFIWENYKCLFWFVFFNIYIERVTSTKGGRGSVRFSLGSKENRTEPKFSGI